MIKILALLPVPPFGPVNLIGEHQSVLQLLKTVKMPRRVGRKATRRNSAVEFEEERNVRPRSDRDVECLRGTSFDVLCELHDDLLPLRCLSDGCFGVMDQTLEDFSGR